MKIAYWIATVLLCLMMIGSAIFYFVKYDDIAVEFTRLGYPTYLILPLATLKLLAALVILSHVSARLSEWAYAGLFFDFVLALSAHVSIRDEDYAGPIVALVLWTASYGLRFAMERRKAALEA